MSFIIEDGTGNGYKTKVSSNNKLEVESTVHAKSHIVAMMDEQAYIANTADTAKTLTTTITGGPILYMKSDNSDKQLILEHLRFTTNTAGGILTILRNVTLGTIGNNNIHTPVNLNFGSEKTVTVTAYNWNEVGNGMTGITGGTIIETFVLPVGLFSINFGGTFILKRTNSIVINFEGVIAEITASLHFYMHSGRL